MKEFYEQIVPDQLKSDPLPEQAYKAAHRSLVIFCHDVFIKYNDGILLIIRDNEPAKGIYWPIGGRVLRGVPTEKSLIKKTKEECNLDLKNIQFLECARTYFNSDPFGHSNGTDTINAVYFAEGKGNLKLDHLHKDPLIVNPESYHEELRSTTHSYVQYYLDIIFHHLF